MPSVTPQKVSGSSLAPEVMVSLLFVLGGVKYYSLFTSRTTWRKSRLTTPEQWKQ